MSRTLTLDSWKMDYSADARFACYATFYHAATTLLADKKLVTCDVASEVTLTAPTDVEIRAACKKRVQNQAPYDDAGDVYEGGAYNAVTWDN